MARTMTMTKGPARTLRRIQQVFGIGTLVVAAAWTATLVPWLRGPAEPQAEVDAGWAVLEAMAAPRRPGGSAELLKEALVAMEGSSRDFSQGIELPLNDAERLAVDRLVAWDQAGGGVGTGACIDPSLPAFAFLDLGHAALAVAEGPEDPRLVAVVHLAEHLRDRGLGVAGLVGFSLSRTALERVDRSAWERPAALREAGPSDAEVGRIIARDVVCTDVLVPTWLASGKVNTREFAEGRLEGLVADYAFDVERERLHLRAHGAGLVDALMADTPEAMAAGLRAGPREAAPASLLVRSTAHLEGLAKQLHRSVEGYEALLAGHGE